MGVVGQRHSPDALPLAKKPGTHYREGWLGPKAGLDGGGKSRLHRDSPVASRYTDWAIAAHTWKQTYIFLC
jgi:hypothetical protein